MRSRLSRKQQIQILQFQLQSIFILQPTLNSKYKIRIRMSHHHNYEEKESQDKNRQTFKVPLVKNMFSNQKEKGFVILLERKCKDDQQNDYLEIGKGEIDLSSLFKSSTTQQYEINGIAYGSRSINFGRIIAKYKYLVQKKVEHEIEGENLQQKFSSVIYKMPYKFIGHSKKYYQPQRQIIAQTTEINRKLRSLTKQIEESVQLEKELTAQHISFSKKATTLIRQVHHEKQRIDIYYKYDNKFYYLLEVNHHNEIRTNESISMKIKNIKIQKHSEQKLNSLIYLNKASSEKKIKEIHHAKYFSQAIKIIFYEEVIHQGYRREIFQIILKIKYNIDNYQYFDQNQRFYLPKTKNKICIEVIQLQNAHRILEGEINSEKNHHTIVELFSSLKQEKGYLILVLEETQGITNKELKQYKAQLQNFPQTQNQYEARSIINKTEDISLSKSLEKYHSESKYQQSESYLQQFPKKKSQRVRRFQTEKSHGKDQSSKMKVELSPLMYYAANSRKRLSMRSDLLHLDSQLTPKTKPNLKYYNISNAKKYKNYRIPLQHCHLQKKKLYHFTINQIYVNVYEDTITNSCKYLQIQIDDKRYETNGCKSKNVEWKKLNIQFAKMSLINNLKISCWMNTDNDGLKTKRIGECQILLTDLKELKNQYKAFLIHQNHIVGYLIVSYELQQKQQKQQRQIENQLQEEEKYKEEDTISENPQALSLESHIHSRNINTNSNTYKDNQMHSRNLDQRSEYEISISNSRVIQNQMIKELKSNDRISKRQNSLKIVHEEYNNREQTLEEFQQDNL